MLCPYTDRAGKSAASASVSIVPLAGLALVMGMGRPPPLGIGRDIIDHRPRPDPLQRSAAARSLCGPRHYTCRVGTRERPLRGLTIIFMWLLAAPVPGAEEAPLGFDVPSA